MYTVIVTHCTAQQTYSKYNIRINLRQQMDRKVRALVNQTCSDIITMDHHIKFVCITDRSGKLLVGQSRSIHSNSMTDRTIDTDGLKGTTCICASSIDRTLGFGFKCGDTYLFYSDFLVWSIEKCCAISNEDMNSNDNPLFVSRNISGENTLTYFQVSGCSKDNIILAITPLENAPRASYSSVGPRAFLCIYFEPTYNVRNSVYSAKNGFEYLLSKITAKINGII